MAIRLDSPGDVIYRAWRVGRGGRRFRMLKFRSMVADADRRGSAVTSAGDNRITPVGHFLRATKLDEFPQFWNVFKGEMTLIGPRPEAPEIVELYTPEQQRILSVKPGLTGPGAISCTVDESMTIPDVGDSAQYYCDHVLARRLKLDADYIRNRSAATDLALISRTVGLMFRALIRKPA